MSIKLDGYGLKSSDVAAIEQIVIAVAGEGGGGGGSGTVTDVTAVAPIVSTEGDTPEISLIGLDGLGNPNQYPGMNAGGTELEWKDLPSVTGVTSVGATSPVASSGGATPVISLLGLSGMGTAGQVPAVNAGATALEWADQDTGGTVTTVTGTNPVVSSGGTSPAISLRGLTGLGTAGQVPTMNSGATGLEWTNPALDLEPVLLTGAGPHALTEAAHAGRDVSCSHTGFATHTVVTGGSDGHMITVAQTGFGGTSFVTGAVFAPPGFKLWARWGESLILRYDAVTAVYLSMTPEQKIVPGTEPNFSIQPIAGSTTISVHGCAALSAIDSAVPTLRAYSAGDSFSHRQRVAAVGTASTASESAGWTQAPSTGILIVPTAAIAGGWKLTMTAGIGDVGTQGFFGMAISSTAIGTGEVEAVANVMGFMAASSAGVGGVDTNMCWGSTTGVTDATLQTLNGGTGFPVNSGSLGPMYQGTIEFRSDGVARWAMYTLRNLATGLAVSGLQTTNLPAEGTLVGFAVVRGTGATAGAGTAIPILEMGWCGAGAWA